ncbi:fibronectin type-III domain-containing protein 3A isoform X2 [Coccinella septempunctata]|uniref:fibronectin type-III domain-containing protein 3A isoform X2 n=1 Tax=Coccinella septempunctata TaxID=41139 RepID=UPI001D07CFC8|nr:fibronectin type-III domain-containing protein 3A isoform X2 [Coccinella septempunctata]
MVANQSVDHQENAEMYCAPPPHHAFGEYYDNSFFMANPTCIHREFGPVTVPMVSTNTSPPIAMPVTVPAGHVVQQIVDENGTLRHVILSPQPPGMVSLQTHSQAYANDTNGSSNQRHYQTIPPHPNYGNPLHHTQIPPPSLQSGAPSPQLMGHSSPPPPHNQTYYKDERAQRQHYKLKKKLYDKQIKGEPPNQPMAGNDGYIGQNNLLLCNNSAEKKAGGNSVETSEDGEESSVQDDEDAVRLITEILSSIEAPLVLDLGSRSALLQWAPPVLVTDAAEGDDAAADISEADLTYEVLLSDKSKEMKFKSIYKGPSLSCRIQDLKPGQEYSVCVQVHYGELQGSATDPIVKFVTPPCEPDKPPTPKLVHNTKNTLQIRWSAVTDNGSPIQSYILECDDGSGEFVEVYKSKGRQHTLLKLRPSTAYNLRLAAVNEIGKSPYSEIVTYSTADNPPSQPQPPTLVEATPTSLHLQWIKRFKDNEFILQLDNPANDYGFMNVYNGSEAHYLCTRLQHFTNYKFRLRAQNTSGYSPWSSEVQYATQPDRPSAPSKPTVKGRIQAYSFKLQWDAPTQTGGSEIEKYILEVNSGSGYRTVYTGKEVEAVCDKLTPGTTYQLRVCCTSRGGVSNYSDPCTVTTDAIPPSQCPPPELTQKPKPESMSLAWSEPDYNGGAPVLEYEVEMCDSEGNCCLVHKNKGMKCVVEGLSPGCEYRFKVRAINRIGRSPWSDELVATSGAAPPCQLFPPTLSVKSSHVVHVEWREPRCNGAPIKEYRLEMNRTEPEKAFEPVYEGLDLQYEVKNLIPATSYDFRVLAVNSAGPSKFSEISTVTTPASTPSAVVFTKHSSTPTTISLHWNEPSNNGSEITGYNIEIGDRHIPIEAPASFYEITSLQCNTSYKIRMQAINSIGNGPYSSILRVATLKFPPSPPKLHCVGIGHNYLKLKWGEGKNLDYLQYCVEVLNPRLKEYQCVYRGPQLTCKVNKLQELTTYKFRINASNDLGVGDFSQEYEFTTSVSPPSILKAPKIVEIEDRTCTLEWLPGKNTFTDSLLYEVQLCRNNENFTRVYRGPDLKYQIRDLREETKYSARVCSVRLAASGELEGPFSPVINFTIPSSKTPEQKVTTTTSTTVTHQNKNKNVIQQLKTRLNFRTMSERQRVFAYAVLFTIIGILLAVMSVTLYDYK